MGMIKFNGASSKDFGVEVETFPNYVAPQKEYEAIHIPGRNGDLLIDSGTYSNVEKRYKVNMVKEPPATEVSGPIANFKSNISLPLSELKTNIEPVQDLHGYSKPWNGGSGKNKFNYDTWKTTGITRGTAVFENNGVTITATENDAFTNWNVSEYPVNARVPISEGETITLSWEESTNRNSIIYIFPNGSTTGMVMTNNQLQKSLTYTATSGVTFVTFRFGVANAGDTIAYKNIQIEKGSQATSWEPYENICPISGFNALTITRTGVNLLDSSTLQNLVSDYDYAEVGYRCRRIQLKPNTRYTVKTTSATAETSPIILINNKTAVNTSPFVDLRTTSSVQTYTTDATGCLYIGIYPNVTDATANARIANCNIEIVLGETEPTTYEPYNGQTATVNFGQTVYGGSLDVTNGKLKITHKLLSIDNNSALYSSDNSAYLNISDAKIVNEYASAISDKYEYNTWSGTTNGDNGYFTLYQNTAWSNARLAFNRNGLSLADFITSLTNNPIEVVYELATPIEIQLTGEDIKTLIGDNNIYSDSGDVTIKTNELATTYSGKMELIANWLNSASGYARLEDSYDPDYYRLAYFNQALDIDNLYDEAGQVTLSFICKPQKFYKSGEESIVFTSAGRIQNRTQHTALPLLKVKTDNTDGTVSIGNSSFGISAGSGTDIIIDCELQNAYYGIENKNNYIVLNDGDFPRIEPGTQVVSFTGGVQSVEVIPRWWTV